MSGNPNIDGVLVPRELAERFAQYAESGKVAEPYMAEDLRALLKSESPAPGFKLKDCREGYGHGGFWCGPDHHCWLDPREKQERKEDFEARKSANDVLTAKFPQR